MTAGASTISIARNRRFVLFLVARTVSVFGENALPIALAALAFQAGFGTDGLGYLLAAPLVPSVVLLLLGGVLADRFTPRRLMVFADAVRVVTHGLMVINVAVGPNLWHLIVLQLATGAANALFQPGVSSMVLAIAPSAEQRANAALRVSESLCQMLAPIGAGTLLVWFSTSAVIGVTAVAFAVSGCALLLIGKVPTMSGVRGSVLRDLGEGWREFRARTWLWSVISVFMVLGLTVFGPFSVLSAAILTETFGIQTFGLLTTVLGVGAVIGGFAAARVRVRRPLAAGSIAMLGMAPLLVALAVGAHLPLLAVGMFVTGIVRSFWAVMWTTSVQLNTPPRLLNRVYAYDVAGSWLMLPIGRALAGPASGALGTEAVLIGSAGFLVVGCGVLLRVRSVRRLELPGAVTVG